MVVGVIMKKKALINDLHFGVRNDNLLFCNYFDLFINNVFIPTLEKNGIEEIIILGDVFDRRKFINYQTLAWVKGFFEKLKNYKIHIILGNHDTFFKNTNQLNSIQLLLSEYSNISIYTEPIEVNKFLFIPWINVENLDSVVEKINKSSCEIVMGHLAITGFSMFKGTFCSEGLNPDTFDKFKSVYSGHFHIKSSSANIHYLGSPWDLTFSDAEDQKGFHLYDAEKDELEFIENPYKMYWKLYYEDEKGKKLKDLLLPKDPYATILNKTYVKVYVKKKTNPIHFDRYIARINEFEPASLTIIDDSFQQANSSENENLSLIEDTMVILKESLNDYNDLLPTEKKKNDIFNLLSELHNEALKL